MAHPHSELTSLPSGQHLIGVFPRYGTHLFRPVPDVSHLQAIRVDGAISDAVNIALADLATMPRRETVADFLCVAERRSKTGVYTGDHELSPSSGPTRSSAIHTRKTQVPGCDTRS